MYKNAKLLATMKDLAERVGDYFRATQTVYSFDWGRREQVPYVERGNTLMRGEYEELHKTFSAGKLYFRIA